MKIFKVFSAASIAGVPLATNQQINSLVPNKNLGSLFLYYCIRAFSSELQNRASKTSQNILNKSKLSNIPIPVPPLEEQHRIEGRMINLEKIQTSNQESSLKIELAQSSLLQKTFCGEL